MERFGNFASLFAALNLQHLDFSLQPCMPTIASATVEADTCRKYVVPLLQAAGWENQLQSQMYAA